MAFGHFFLRNYRYHAENTSFIPKAHPVADKPLLILGYLVQEWTTWVLNVPFGDWGRELPRRWDPLRASHDRVRKRETLLAARIGQSS